VADRGAAHGHRERRQGCHGDGWQDGGKGGTVTGADENSERRNMSEKYKITITPNNHNGWLLEFCKSHDGKSDYRARNGARHVYAETLDDLIRDCDEADKITVKFRKPILAMRDDGYAPGFKPVSITMVCGERFVYRDTTGETHEGYLSWLSLSENNRERGKWIFDNAANQKIRSRVKALRVKVSALKDAIEDLNKKLQPITSADLMIAAKVGK